MSNTFYGMKFNPFNKEFALSDGAFKSEDFIEMRNRLEYLVNIRGIGVFTARPGMGKTYALKCFSKSLNPSLMTMEYMRCSTISILDFYKQFAMILGIEPKGGKPKLFKSIQEEIYYRYREKKRPLILAIDESQYLSTSILNDLKMLMNFEYDSVNCFTLILCGESHMNHILRRPIHEALRQRIMVHYDFKGLADDEISEYITHKIISAGASPNIIDDAAIRALSGSAQGNPRIIDNIMSDAIKIGAQTERHTIDSDTVYSAINNQIL